MNAAISFVVAVVSVLIVAAGAAWCVDRLLGQYSLLGWICLGWFGFLGLLKALRS